jgi:hypothetical protein
MLQYTSKLVNYFQQISFFFPFLSDRRTSSSGVQLLLEMLNTFDSCLRFGRDSKIVVATGYRLDGRDSVSGRSKVLLFSTSSRPALGPIKFISKGHRGDFQRSKAVGA